MIHTAFRQGQRILVILTGGSSFVAKFKESKSRKLFFLDREYVDLAEVRSATIYRNRTR